MTAREWMEKNAPENIDPKFFGGIKGCPSRYHLLKDPDNCMSSELSCRACWDRKIPETFESEEKKTVEYRPCESCEEYKKEIEEHKKKIEEFRSLLDDNEREIAALRGKNDRLTDKVNTLWDTNYHYELVIKTVEALIGKNIISADCDD